MGFCFFFFLGGGKFVLFLEGGGVGIGFVKGSRNPTLNPALLGLSSQGIGICIAQLGGDLLKVELV